MLNRSEVSSVKCQVSSGQSLVEVVVALGVVVVLAIALVSASLVTQKTSRSASDTVQATKLVQQNIEQVRTIRDRKGFSVLTNGDCFVLTNTTNADPETWNLSSSGCPATTVGGNTIFTRSIRIENGVNANQKKVTVTVNWSDSGGAQKVEVVTFLSNCINNQTIC